MQKNTWMLCYKELKLTRKEKGFLVCTKDNQASMLIEDKNLKFPHQGKPAQEDTERYKEAVAEYLISNYDGLLIDLTAHGEKSNGNV